MDEQEFWGFLDGLLVKGRASAVIGAIGCVDSPEYVYLQGHTLLPKDYDKLCAQDIINIGTLLLKKETSRKAKETIMMILAHQPSEIALTFLAKYNLSADKDLEIFAEMALEECAMWNE